MLCTISLSLNVSADVTQAELCLTEFLTSVRQENHKNARRFLTKSSIPWYDKIITYQLQHDISKNWHSIGHALRSNHTYLKIKKTTPFNNDFLLAFKKEDERFKVDLEESMRKALGEYWKEKVLSAEQLFIFYVKIYGDTGKAKKAIRSHFSSGNRVL